MTFKLTKRDKALLYILALVVLVVGVGYFLILPEIDETMALREQALFLQQEYDALLLRQARIPALEEQIETARQEVDELSEPLYAPMTNAQVDSLLTGLLLSHGLEPRKMDIASSGEELTKPYPFSGQIDPGTLADDPLTVITTRVSGSAIGGQAQWLDLLDTLAAHYPAIRVCSFSLSTVQQRVGEELVSVTELSYTLELYGSSELEAPET